MKKTEALCYSLSTHERPVIALSTGPLWPAIANDSNILFQSRLHVYATLLLNTFTSWHETMLVLILFSQK